MLNDNVFNIFFLPLDNRPCSYKYLLDFFEIIYEQKNIKNLNLFWDFDFYKLISNKYLNSSKTFSNDYYILSLDAFLFGNLINSRFIDSYKKYQTKLNYLINFIRTKKNSFFYLYISIPRIILNSKRYSNKYSEILKKIDINKIIKISFEFSKKIRNIFKKYNYKKFNKIIPILKDVIKKNCNLNEVRKYYSILRSFLITRKNKFNLIKFLLDRLYFLKKKYNLSNFELIVSLDDSQKKAINFLELDFFKNYLNKKLKTISKLVYFFIGLDEIHLIILAKAFISIFNPKNQKINILFNNNINNKIGRYEGKSLKEILKIYYNYFKKNINLKFIPNIKNLNDLSKYGKYVDLNKSLFVNLFSDLKRYQEESISQILNFISNLNVNPDNVIDFFKIYRSYFNSFCDLNNNNVLYNVKYLCDIEYSNGPSLNLIFFYLYNYEIFKKLNLYFSWNTLANSLGSALAFFILFSILKIKEIRKLKEFVLNRFLEGIYQSIIRYFAKKYNWDTPKIKQAFIDIFKYFNINDIELEYIDLPWNRYFEIDISAKYKYL